ncbi:uncharacterized protein LOC126724903 [Quercus robur]|uniref:uncharacterized protein LOC126724903 n=1 Tax=Quercus robur TaxID=38942 RepID=UPI002161E6D0|nr:uncharacterized protein LOC126724903 [Quercus robur]
MKEGSDRISLRLDRAFATSDWLEYFKSPKVHYLVESTSDHCILTITDSSPPARKNKCRFHFEAMWVKREDCREVIKAAWNSGALFVTPEGVASNLKRCADALTTWNQNVVGNISKQIQEKRKALNSLTMNDQHGSRGADINCLRKEINDLLDSEETIWRQRSKVHWYKEGDRNTKFFHARASERRRKNTILGLWNDNGEWCESKESITAVAISYFENIYSTSFPTGIEEITNVVPRRVTEEMNAELTKVFTRDEVTKALQQLHPTKAPGPDVIINGEAKGNIIPSRGIRQGDPLSPCLFLLCAEGLSTLIHEVARNQQINGIAICRGCPRITHLFFADDSLLFLQSNGSRMPKSCQYSQ